MDKPTETAPPTAALDKLDKLDNDDRSPVAKRPRRRPIPPSLGRARKVLPEAFQETPHDASSDHEAFSDEPPTSPTPDAVTASDTDAGWTLTIEASEREPETGAAPRPDPKDERLDFGDLEPSKASEDDN